MSSKRTTNNTNATKTNNAVDFQSLYNELITATTKKQLVDTMNKYGLRTTTLPTTTPNVNDLYIQFIDKSRVLIGKKSLKLYTNDKLVDDFSDYKFDVVNDGSYRNRRATVEKSVEQFTKLFSYFLTNNDNWLVTK